MDYFITIYKPNSSEILEITLFHNAEDMLKMMQILVNTEKKFVVHTAKCVIDLS